MEINQIVIIKAGDYKVAPGSSSFNRGKKKVSFEYSTLGRVGDTILDKKGNIAQLLIHLEYGSGNVYNRSKHLGSTRSNVTFYVNVNDAKHDGTVNRIHRNIVKKKDPNLKKGFLFVSNGKHMSESPFRHSIDEMYLDGGKNQIYLFNSGVTVAEKDLIPLIDSRIENIVLAKALAKKRGIKLRDTTEYEQEDEEQITFNLYSFDFYRNTSGHMNIRPEEIESFRSDFLALFNKYNVSTLL